MASGIVRGYMQHSRAHHRRQRERNEHAHHHCRCGCDSELVEESSGDARHERYGNEDDDETQRRRENGVTDVGGRSSGGIEGSHFLFFHEPERVFEHDQRVVNDDADHQYQRQAS